MEIDALPSGKTTTVLHVPGPPAGGPGARSSGDRTEGALDLPLLVAKGVEPGPTLAVLGAVHGDEYEGVLAIHDAFERLDPQRIAGTVIAVPVTNLPAYRARTRSTPEDGKNLARVFPGDAGGTVTERIAFHVGREIIGRADLLLDLHSSGTALTSPTMVGYYAHPGPAGRLAASAAEAFGVDVVWEHPTIAPGRTLSLAAELGIPGLYTEAAGGMRVRPDDLAVYTAGILNAMGALGMIDRPPVPPPTVRIGGDGDTDAMTAVTHAGLFRPRVGLLQRVREGEPVGVVRDLSGRVVETVASPRTGRIAFLRAVPAVEPGDAAVLVADDLAPELTDIR